LGSTILSLQKPNEFKVIVLDNGAFHKAKRLKISENILLIFLPPFSPELNSAKKMWAKFKRAFTNKVYKTLNDVSVFIKTQVQKLNPEETKKTCRYDYVILNHFWTNV
jgi:transposase